jgi:hypothetical protein
LPYHERMVIREQERLERIELLKRENIEREMQECTFAPKVEAKSTALVEAQGKNIRQKIIEQIASNQRNSSFQEISSEPNADLVDSSQVNQSYG